MNNELKQQVSELLDNELASPAAFDLLQKARHNPEITSTLNRYAAISQAIKSEAFILADNDFSARIARQIEQEPLYLLPQRKQPSLRRYQWPAMAASLAAVLVLAAHGLDKINTPETNASLQLAQKATPEPTKQAAANSEQTEQPLNARIYDYLQAHNNSVYTSGESDFKPLVKVTSYANRR